MLGKIPYLGHLFRHRSNTARESELLVFITPEIVTPCYGGTPREQCIGPQLQGEIDQTPTHPIPFGIEVIRAEDRARNYEINHRHGLGCCCPTCCGSKRNQCSAYCDNHEMIVESGLPLDTVFNEMESDCNCQGTANEDAYYLHEHIEPQPTPATNMLPTPVLIEP